MNRTTKRLALTGLSLLICAAAPAVAGTTLFAGLSAPLGDMADAHERGLHAGADLHLPVVPLVLSAGPSVAYHRMGLEGADGDAGYLELLATAAFTFPLGPRLIGGAGYAFAVEEPDGPTFDLENEFTLVLGTGWKFLLLDARALWHGMGDRNFLTLSLGLGF